MANYPNSNQTSCQTVLVYMLLFLATGLLVWRFWPGNGILGQLHENGGDKTAQARVITPRGSLAEDEKSTIALFKEASPSVVYVTSLSEYRDRFSLNVQEIPRGTGSGIIWDDKGRIVTNYHVI